MTLTSLMIALLVACGGGDPETGADDTAPVDSGDTQDSGDTEDTGPDAAPTIGALGAVELYDGSSFDISVDASDDRAGLTLSATADDASLLASAVATETDSGWTLTITGAGQGTTTVTVVATDSGGQTAETTFELTTWFDRRGITGEVPLPDGFTGTPAVASDGEIYISGRYRQSGQNPVAQLRRLNTDMTFDLIDTVDEYWAQELLTPGVAIGDTLWVGTAGYDSSDMNERIGGFTRFDLVAGTHVNTLAGGGSYGVGADALSVSDDGAVLSGDWGLVRRYDASGAQLWEAHPAGTVGVNVLAAIDGDETQVVVSAKGNYFSQPTEGRDFYLVRLGVDGETLSSTLITAPGDQAVAEVLMASDGDVVVCGVTDDALGGQSVAGGRDLFVQKFGTDGTLRWTRLIGATGNETFNSISEGDDGRLYLSARYDQRAAENDWLERSDGLVAALNGADGTVAWQTLLGDPDRQPYASAVVPSGLDLIVAWGQRGGTSSQQVFQRFDLQGNPQ